MPRIAILFLVLLSVSCQKEYSSQAEIREKLQESELFLRSVENLTHIQIHDIFAPPVASRVYVYPSIAAYEAIQVAYPEYESFANRLHGLSPFSASVDTQKVYVELAAVYAFNEVAKAFIFSEEKMGAWQAQVDSIVNTWQVNPKMIERTKDYANEVKQHILAWSKTDNYLETRTMPKFSVNDGEPARWSPTPPAYMEGIEPHWNKMRTMVIDSAAQFKPAAPPPFDLSAGSPFYQLAKEVYEVGNNLTEEQTLIANFWDCNPFKMNQSGHVMFASKKITPGGHWMGITGVACRKAKADQMATVNAHALVSIGLFDAFISCWDEKYRSVLVRPETVINQKIDPDWLPTLQTPPFPEHTSGHSVISTASAVILTSLFGDNFSFVDNVEVEFGLPERSFNSFLEASSEAAISRLYGGIHYRPAIEDGVTQGKQVGNFIVHQLLPDRAPGVSQVLPKEEE
ncbi:MAG TPA: vanadium-dependent haloperoxidase [Saprospiraceae bacterium]|nr:vanadium-dependent haloperoxidase [Saprospiraceae bacterium]HMQ84189.1 vanadium-dependent haloperoxidase [Saprospiraceae bacterium]